MRVGEGKEEVSGGMRNGWRGRDCEGERDTYFQAQNSVRVIEFAFRRSRGILFVKTHFSGALLSRKTENVSETAFQAPKPEHANASIIITLYMSCILVCLITSDQTSDDRTALFTPSPDSDC